MVTPEQTELIKAAGRGHEDSLRELSVEARRKVCAYLYRMTMDYDLAEDLAQETILEMVNSLNDLRSHESFWAWLYQIARSKLQGHYRREAKHQRHKTDTFYKQYVERLNEEDSRDDLKGLLNTELARAVVNAMGELKPNEREILSLRCLDQLSYTAIAEITQCSESNARIQFFRAKQALRKRLAREGIGKGSLLAVLGFFGKLTSTDAAAESPVVPAATLHVSVGTAVIATLGLKTLLGVGGLVLLSASAGTAYVAALPEPTTPWRDEVTSMHYTIQSGSDMTNTPTSLSKGAYELWFHYLGNVDSPVWMRMQRWNPEQTEELCAWLQNGQANYFYHCGNPTVYLQNHRIWRGTRMDILVYRLPSDPPELHAFLDGVEGTQRGLTRRRDRRTGLITEIHDTRHPNAKDFQSTCEYNNLDAATFQPFWPEDAKIIDERDEMRKRGWTCFEVSGQLDGTPITGTGCIPFFTDHLQEHPPWLTLQVGDHTLLTDTPAGAEYAGRRYPPGTFFAGLLRPWMGLHAIDIVRRDAAQQELPFETIQENNYYADATVLINRQSRHGSSRLEYVIDMDGDLILQIALTATDSEGNPHEGLLQFQYHQSLDTFNENAFTPPALLSKPSRMRKPPGIQWLFDLAAGDF